MLEIPELEVQLKEDEAEIKNAATQVPHAEDELNRIRPSRRRFISSTTG